MFMIIKHFIIPRDKFSTSMKDYKNKGEKIVQEKVLFRNKINKKELLEATYIINLMNGVIEKNKHKDNEKNAITNEEILIHYLKEYKHEISRSGFIIKETK